MLSFFMRTGQVLLGLGLFYLYGCDAPYYAHLARGQGKILLHRVPIEEILIRPQLNSDHRRQFELIQSIRTFSSSLGLQSNDSYTTFFDTQGQPISWNISASPPDHFKPFIWDFPIAGSVPYKGFFSREQATKERDALISAGYDAIARPVSAYSTLGFFSDPVLSGMLSYSPGQLADLILHELTHATAYSSGHTDYNESLATFIGQQGSLVFLTDHFGQNTPHLQQAKERREDISLFREFMATTVASLDSLYSLGYSRETVLKQRSAVFTLRKAEYKKIKAQFARLNYDYFLDWEVNNAQLLSFRRYNSKQDLFLSVHKINQHDFTRSMQVFSSCAETDDPWHCLLLASKVQPIN
jgi:predicted aminopeptidase